MYLCNATSILKVTSGNAVPCELVSRQQLKGMGSSTELVTVSSFFSVEWVSKEEDELC